MKTIRAATTICAALGIAGLFLPVGRQGGSPGMSGPGLQNNGSPRVSDPAVGTAQTLRGEYSCCRAVA
jgi:hypothetical protein